MLVNVKIVADCQEKCYNIEWPSSIVVEDCLKVTEVVVNDFRINDVDSICHRDRDNVVIEFSETNPLRWMLKLKNEYYFQRVNIQ